MKQSTAFYMGEAQAWLDRNKDKLPPDRDPVIDIIETAGISPHNVLEVGCGNGWRIDILAEKYGCSTWGIDPVVTPEMGRKHGSIFTGAADKIGFRDSSFDLVIYGFCLYLVDREDLFKVAAEGDRVLKDGGYLIIQDFMPIAPYKVKYKHKDGIFSYKMDYSKLWLANPTYSLFGVATSNPVDDVGVIVLQKDINNGWPIQD